MNENLKTIFDFIQQNENLTADEKDTYSKAVKDADKELAIIAFKLDRTEKVKRTTAILLEETIEELELKRKAVEAQNRELEIEAALERVRAVALSIQNPAEMAEVCRIISEQLEFLKIKHIRNIQTAVIDEKKGTYINYEYYARHEKLLITEVSYKTHHLQEEFAHRMLKGEFFSTSLKGQEVKNWYEYQKTTNQFADFFLEESQTLNYYMFSLGSVALGISTYSPLTEEEINLFKRFRNVFELAYGKFLDIQKAEAHAREAQIEAALERIRSRSLAMHTSADLGTVVYEMFTELVRLDAQLDRCLIMIVNPETLSITWYLTGKEGLLSNNGFLVQNNPHPSHRAYLEGWRTKRKKWNYLLAGEEKRDWDEFGFTQTGLAQLPDFIKADMAAVEAIHLTISSGDFGCLIASSLSPLSEIHAGIVDRFTTVFNQTYTRFLDLQKAEAQAKEAQIESALERVRSRTMGMQKSDELAETVSILFKQLLGVGVEFSKLRTCGIATFHETEPKGNVFMSDINGDIISDSFEFRFDEAPSYKKIYAAREKEEKFMVLHLTGDALIEHFTYVKKYSGVSNIVLEKFGKEIPEIFIHVMFFSKGYLFVVSYEPISEHHETLKRFGLLFQQTYTRFLDLQKAEAQAREAQIEAALERVRSRSMAMHNSQELKEVALELRKQMGVLGQKDLEVCAIHLYDDENSFESWSAMKAPGSEGEILQTQARFPNKGIKIIDELMKHYSNGSKDYILVNEDEKIIEWFKVIKEHAPELHASIIQSIGKLPVKKQKSNWSIADFSGGALVMVTYGEPDSTSRNLLRRSANVFEQAYIRFLDLQKAEAQAREAQIEAALERVRSRSMGMQKSEELKEVIKLVYRQLLQLKINLDHAGFVVDYKPKGDWTFWIADEQDIPSQITHPYFESVWASQFNEAKEKGADLFVTHLNFEEKNKFYQELLSYIPGLSETSKEFYLSCPGLAATTVLFNDIGLYIENFSGIPYSDEENKILIRFGKVFQQTYTRFLDLQKAEAQAREAKIEAALEKVRSRSLAMHKSDELWEVVAVVFEKFQELKFSIDGAAFIGTFIEDSSVFNCWLADDKGQSYPTILKLPYYDSPSISDIWLAKESGLDFFSKTYSFEEKNHWLSYAFEHTDLKIITDEFKNWILDQPCLTQPIALGKNSLIGIHFHHQRTLSETEIDILKRFSKVFDQAYIRFLDLQKAEAQAREAHIQLALERVRARTMAMHHSSELADTATILFEQIKELGFEIWSCGFGIWRHEVDLEEAWMSTGDLFPIILVPFKEDPTHLSIYEASQRGESVFEVEVKGDVLTRHYNWLMSLPSFKKVFSQIENSGIILPTVQWKYAAFFKQGYLHLITTKPQPDIHDIGNRFAKVFEQTYTRFLDLQKAEAQAREAKIEAALEKVRSRTMAMQRSEELPEVAGLLFQQVKTLGVPQFHCGFNIFEIDDKECTWYPGSADGDILPPCKIPLTEHPVFMNFIESRKRGDELCVYEKEGEYQAGHYRYMLSLPVLGEILQNMLDAGIPFPTFQIDHLANFSHGNLLFITSEHFPEMHDTFKRFAKVFEQTYTRFLDLQKAEAQAREAQIEAALERVRSRSMGMQKSDELRIVVQEIYDQFVHLGIDIFGADFRIDYREREDWHIWSADRINSFPSQLNIPYFDHPYWNAWNDAKRKGVDALTYTMGLGEKNSFVLGLSKHIPNISAEGLEIVLNTPGYSVSNVFLQHIALSIDRFKPEPFADADNAILMRFAKVFEQSYTRFLDLKKAEAQAREAQIEAALERVRASTMAMHRSEQLAETAKVLFEQFDLLGKVPDRISIGIIKEEKQLIEWWVTNQNGSRLNYGFNASISEPSMAKVFTAWKEKKDSVVIELTGKDLQDWIRFVREEVKMEIDETKMKGRRVHQGAFFSQGVLLFSTHEPVAEDVMQLLVRFARVFNQTYTRFLDLQKAELQAKEAIKASSLDRVRGEIASMRTVDDLQRITPIIWHELNALGVPFVRCGVFIMNEATEHVQVHLSAPDGHSLGLLDLPFNSGELTTNTVNHWRKGIIFKTHWNRQDFLDFMQSMITEGQVLNPETYQGASAPPESLYLHFVPFKQGMLYVGNSSPLEIDELQLVKSLAESFSIAYARYEDFRQLENAKNQIEKTFTELKAAQSQLIQSEKMASLGELTAGIAHEIQNPLNFVNNFSEVSNELLDEMKEEMAVGNNQLANEIADDIKQNLEKINHHGKRAADIVKGMLQHSRTSNGVKEPTDINSLADEYLRLAYHGLRAKDKSFNADFKTDFDPTLPKINVIPQDIGRVLLNLINNAFYAAPLPPEGGFKDPNYIHKPTVTVRTASWNPPTGGRGALISVSDNGPGIPPHIVDKIFQPFFTTKPTGQGTGLGLSLSYDIIKAHGGELKVETILNEGVTFNIIIPYTSQK